MSHRIAIPAEDKHLFQPRAGMWISPDDTRPLSVGRRRHGGWLQENDEGRLFLVPDDGDARPEVKIVLMGRAAYPENDVYWVRVRVKYLPVEPDDEPRTVGGWMMVEG